jgi:predicted Zn-dependent peptidase
MGRIPLGEPDTVSVIGATGVRRHWDTHCRPENLLVAVAGGLTSEAVINTLNDVFGNWLGESSEPKEPHSISVADRNVHHEKPSEQTHICMLSGSMPRGHELYYAGQLTVAILSGGGSSRLFTEVREKRGLAYNVAAFYQARKGGGLLAIYAGTTPDRAQETLDVCQMEIARLAKDVTEEELTRAKTVLKGRLFTTGDLPEGRAGGLIEDLFLQNRVRTIDEIAAGIDAVTRDQIPQYLETFPTSPNTLLVLGPQSLTKN